MSASKIFQGPNLEYSMGESTLGKFFFNLADKYSDKICQVDGKWDKVESYAGVKLRSTRVAIELQKRGITSKDVITCCSTNTLDLTISIVATSFLGAQISNLDSSLSARHTHHLLSLVTPKIIFVEESAVKLIEESLIGSNFKTEIVVFGKSQKYTMFSELLKSQEDEERKFRPSEVDPSDTAIMFFSSGTTGLPKAICHSHDSLLNSCAAFYQVILRGDMFHFTAMYWITAIMMMICCYRDGKLRVFCHNPGGEDVFRIIDKYKVKMIFTAPILTYKLTNFENLQKYDLSSVESIMCGGTPMATVQVLKMRELFKNALVTQGYGLTEVGLATGFDRYLEPELARRKMKSTGKPGPALQLKIVDLTTENLLGPNKNGEVRIKAPYLMKGYYKQNSLSVFDKEGFLKTGDLGYCDDEGCLYIEGRIKEMFKYLSWHIIPSTIEKVLLEHPLINEAVVFGVPRNEEGEVPGACIMLEDEKHLTEEDIDIFLKTRVADRERLRGGVTFVKSLPKTASGKIVRNEVRDFVLKSK